MFRLDEYGGHITVIYDAEKGDTLLSALRTGVVIAAKEHVLVKVVHNEHTFTINMQRIFDILKEDN